MTEQCKCHDFFRRILYTINMDMTELSYNYIRILFKIAKNLEICNICMTENAR